MTPGLLLALASALAYLFKYRGAVLVAPIRVRHPLASAAALFRSEWFAIGWLVANLAWVLHVGALALAPLSIVQAVLSGGLVFLAVLSPWTLTALVAGGIAFDASARSLHVAPGSTEQARRTRCRQPPRRRPIGALGRT